MLDKYLPIAKRFPVGTISKEDRLKMHVAVKTSLETPVNSNTVDVDDAVAPEGKKVLVISKRVKKDDRRERWPGGLPKFLHFVMYCEGIDTMSAAGAVAKRLK